MTERRRLAVHQPSRREFLSLVGLVGTAGLAACTRAPRGEIVPYVVQPPEVTPGVPRWYATASVLDGYATGLLVESHEGRPTKVEGNPDHPASLGGTSAFDQASVLSLYDPARGTGSWPGAKRALATGRWRAARGEGLTLVMAPVSSPAIAAMLARLREAYPRAEVRFHASASRTSAWDGARIAFGRVLEPRWDLARADVIVALDADLLASGPAALRHARQRRGESRLYVVEPLWTPTGAVADHRLRVRASEVVAVAGALGAEVAGLAAPGWTRERTAPHRRFVDALARDLRAHRGRAVVVAGDAQPPVVHALAHVVNAAIDAPHTLAVSPVLDAGETSHGPLAGALAGAETVVVLGANVAYEAPHVLAALARAEATVYLGAYEDETAAACRVAIAEAHPLESWGDARAFDGTLSVVQPLVEPLFGGRTAMDVLGVLLGEETPVAARDRVRAGFASDEAFRQALRRGVAPGSAFPPAVATLDRDAVARALAATAPPRPPRRAEIELVARPDPRVHDGRFAQNAWLLELPAPFTTLTWTNAATLSRAAASEMGVGDGDELELASGAGVVRAPAMVVPGQADGVVGLTLGWGRSAGAPLAHGRGANAHALGGAIAVRVTSTGRRRPLPVTQLHKGLEGREGIVAPARASPTPAETLYHLPPRGPRRYGMAIDLGRCTACGSCVVACQAENNVPAVGEDGVLLGRAMHWLRVDAYFVGEGDDAEVASQPMLCQHCERAPCEYVCPTNATVHDDGGLNQMVYNRCVGTRFCSNNCPYKVRRFNWFDYHRGEGRTEELAHNPDVTVRERGVMEKCTFCVQRIRAHERHGRPLTTACAQACPTQAIVFGDLADARSEVAARHADPRGFSALGDLGTFPRVRYLARKKNPNPELRR
jgi:molybdopterin-containing oxidoreductase family iron-sulfur binding subunit